MTTIFTKYMPRDTLPTRIKAWTSTRGQAVYVVHNPSESQETNHRAACDKLAARLHWHDRHFIAGMMPDGFVFVPCDVSGPHTHGEPTADQSLSLPIRNNGATHAPEPARPTRDRDAEFTAAMTTAGITPDIITRLIALRAEDVFKEYKQGHLRFTSPQMKLQFVEALSAWSAA